MSFDSETGTTCPFRPINLMRFSLATLTLITADTCHGSIDKGFEALSI